MLKDVSLGQYYPGNSFVHALDPRTKLLMTLTVVVSLFLVNSFTGLLGFAGMTLVTCLLARIPVTYLLRSLRPLIFIIVLTFVLNAFFTSGEVEYRIWFIGVSREGVVRGVFMASRLSILVLSSSLLTLTTSPMALTDGLERLMMPLTRIGVPAHEFAMMMTIALRFIPTLLEEAEKTMKAQMARGADFESGNIFVRAKSFIPLLVPLFVGAFRRADDLATAMEARCYRGGEGRTRMKVIRIGYKDALAALIFAPLLVLLIFFF